MIMHSKCGIRIFLRRLLPNTFPLVVRLCFLFFFLAVLRWDFHAGTARMLSAMDL